MTLMGIALELLLHQQRQPVEALAHVRVPSREPHPRAWRRSDHERRLPSAIAAITADSIAQSTAPLIRIRAPLANSISISPAVLASAATRLSLIHISEPTRLLSISYAV